MLPSLCRLFPARARSASAPPAVGGAVAAVADLDGKGVLAAGENLQLTTTAVAAAYKGPKAHSIQQGAGTEDAPIEMRKRQTKKKLLA